VALFTVEYILRMWCCVEDKNKDKSWSDSYYRWKYFWEPLTLVDLVSVLPFFIDIVNGPGDQLENSSGIRALRLFRFFKGEKYFTAFALFAQVWRENKHILMYTGVLALILWVSAASVFYMLEKDNPHMEGAFSTVPNALFMTAILLGGEWCRTDFTTGGKFFGVIMCWLIINIFAVPIGIVASGFEQAESSRRKNKTK